MAKKKEEKTTLEEPSVLDYFKAVFSFGRIPIPEIPELPDEGVQTVVKKQAVSSASDDVVIQERIQVGGIPWKAFAAVVLPIFAQRLLEPPDASTGLAVILYLLACGLLLWAVLSGELSLAAGYEPNNVEDDLKVQAQPLAIGIVAALIAYLAFGGNEFTFINVAIWGVALYFIVTALWPKQSEINGFQRIIDWVQKADWQFSINRWQVLFLLVLGLGVFFRLTQLGQISPEMFSDQAEKLLDVYELLDGDTHIYFERNTGREAFQMYLTAWVSRFFNTGITFLSLKIGTALMGIFSLPFIYLIGKEVGNKWVGLIAMFFAGVSFWPNVLARAGLRFILYPAFAAPVLYYLLRGLRKLDRKDFVLAGIFLGIGLHGYTPYRIVPILVVVMVGLYWLHSKTWEERNRAMIGLGIVAFVSLIVFLPLLRYWMENPGRFNYRALSRLGTVEQPLPGSPLEIFWQNVRVGLLMFNVRDGNIWVISIPNRPLLDVVTGGMLVLGVFIVFVRYIRNRDWRHLFLILAIPIMMLPSTLSLAFPDENPAPNRAGGVMVVVFVLAALALEALLRGIYEKVGGKTGLTAAWGLGLFLAFWAAGQNYDLTFKQYHEQFIQGAWNTSELGGVIKEFSNTIGTGESAWVVAYPHWVDTRLVGMNAGYPTKDFAIWPDQIETTTEIPGPKIFLFKPEDIEALAILNELYPTGSYSLFESEQSETKNFNIYFVPAE